MRHEARVLSRRLLEEMTDQHIKEVLLAYIVLLTSSTGAT